eukprot:GHVN01060941.1.p1 GENE.GHVN01060941.1~~GHVN01060941.1.p1  ORF type:complete len:247 (+),score=36.71 GHVN01060941.1:831-1571(+)
MSFNARDLLSKIYLYREEYDLSEVEMIALIKLIEIKFGIDHVDANLYLHLVCLRLECKRYGDAERALRSARQAIQHVLKRQEESSDTSQSERAATQETLAHCFALWSRLCAETGRLDEALECFSSVLRLSPLAPPLHCVTGSFIIQADLQLQSEVKQMYKKFLQEYPEADPLKLTKANRSTPSSLDDSFLMFAFGEDNRSRWVATLDTTKRIFSSLGVRSLSPRIALFVVVVISSMLIKWFIVNPQ